MEFRDSVPSLRRYLLWLLAIALMVASLQPIIYIVSNSIPLDVDAARRMYSTSSMAAASNGQMPLFMNYLDSVGVELFPYSCMTYKNQLQSSPYTLLWQLHIIGCALASYTLVIWCSVRMWLFLRHSMLSVLSWTRASGDGGTSVCGGSSRGRRNTLTQMNPQFNAIFLIQVWWRRVA